VLVGTNSTTPAITSVVDNVAGGTVGAIVNGGLTNDNKPTLNGTAVANAIVTICEGGNVLGSVKAGADGKWSLEQG
ncbi:Ig-like domain-containing protein, partial [Pantoea sp. GbtcB22]|uniref:Ig-like domain-containing protein n=1 Tax=Pantoea sp. GbtcB22 TaxID=2824767 RepID=UPI001C30A44B